MRRWFAAISIAFVLLGAQGVSQTQRAALRYRSTATKRVATARAATAKGRSAPKKVSRPAYDLAAVNNPATADVLKENDAGTAVLRAQILLDRAHFSVGEIDGRVGTNTLRALDGFRAARGLPPGQTVDRDVWNELNADMGEVLSVYTTVDADLEGPFVEVPAEMMAKAKLDHLGYASPLDELAERFHVNPALLKQINPGSKFAAAGEQVIVPNVTRSPLPQAARIVVSKSASTVTAYDDQGNILAVYPCTSGSEHDPLPIGEWKVTGIYHNPKFHYNPIRFWDAKATDSKATIAPGPRNPVGPVWIDLSKEHYGIHGTPAPSSIGHTQSHGCIRLTNWDALELASIAKRGTPAILQE
jgi:lipoprotein-anchoring transpeptidase ErfK/SrfK